MIDIERTLRKVVSNFWFEWNSNVHLLFRGIDPYAWSLFRRNLYRFLKVHTENVLLYRHRLAELLTDARFMQLAEQVEQDFKNYMNPQETLVSKNFPELKDKTIAYFSMEYGIDILKIYSGGLGILSGDHLRGASDLGLKMVGVGLFYWHGYYTQQIAQDGTMQVVYEPLVPLGKPVRDYLPVEPVKKKDSTEDLIISVELPGRKLKARVWRARIGRCDLFLLDSDLRENKVHDRHITRRLYASQKQYEEERRMRIEQEILLGIGGVRALIESGLDPAVYHLNEGHVAFAALEVIRNLIQKKGLSFEDARHRCGQILGFTTHTPVPEGNERYDERMAREYLTAYLDSFLRPHERETIFNCARNREDMFDMTKLSLLLSGVCRNGVSALHGEVCRKMWGYAWGNFDPAGNGVPIDSVTNAVHVPYWQKPVLRDLIKNSGGLEKVRGIPDQAVWNLHVEFKTKLIEKVRERAAYQLLRYKAELGKIYDDTCNLLSTDSFMIGFARRFAEYKRVTMLLDDEERLFQFMENTFKKYGKPVHILYAGKPHPNNHSGRERISYILGLSNRLAKRAKERNFQGQIVFIQGYDIDLARYLEAGVDIWLNNPIRPLEASGTSGMKAGMNGVLNVSVSDGWVPEGIKHGVNGWLFGRGDHESTENDRNELFRLLEDSILPIYFDRKPGEVYSAKWVALMKESIQTITTQFNTDRMLTDYVEKMYLPAVQNYQAAEIKAH